MASVIRAQPPLDGGFASLRQGTAARFSAFCRRIVAEDGMSLTIDQLFAAKSCGDAAAGHAQVPLMQHIQKVEDSARRLPGIAQYFLIGALVSACATVAVWYLLT